jgi:hypothetical protein
MGRREGGAGGMAHELYARHPSGPNPRGHVCMYVCMYVCMCPLEPNAVPSSRDRGRGGGGGRRRVEEQVFKVQDD